MTEFYNYLLDGDNLAISQFFSVSLENNTFLFNFVSFNYTNVLDKCLDITKPNIENFDSRNKKSGQYHAKDKIKNVIHIHGTLQNNLILGVDNVEQINNETLKKDNDFLWKIVKPLINKELKKTSVK